MAEDRTAAVDRPAAAGVLTAACVSTLVVNANTSAVTILLPSISEDVHEARKFVRELEQRKKIEALPFGRFFAKKK